MGKVTPLKIDVNDGRLPLKDKGLDMKDFSSVAELRRDQLEKLAAGFRLFDYFGFNEGVAGHITYRDPEFKDLFLGKSTWCSIFLKYLYQIFC